MLCCFGVDSGEQWYLQWPVPEWDKGITLWIHSLVNVGC